MSDANHPISKPEDGFFEKLSSGDYGLAKTYWIYGVLVGVVVGIITNAITSTNVFITVTAAHSLYSIPVFMGIWRSASKYDGPKIWAILAKIATAFGVLVLLLNLMVIIGLLSNS